MVVPVPVVSVPGNRNELWSSDEAISLAMGQLW